jgi:hypothetical protein
MSASEMTTRPRGLSDEEWCELCFLVVDMDTARDRLQNTLIAHERPTLDQLWFAMRDYQRVSDRMFDYLSTTLRAKVRADQQAA